MKAFIKSIERDITINIMYSQIEMNCSIPSVAYYKNSGDNIKSNENYNDKNKLGKVNKMNTKYILLRLIYWRLENSVYVLVWVLVIMVYSNNLITKN